MIADLRERERCGEFVNVMFELFWGIVYKEEMIIGIWFCCCHFTWGDTI